LGSFSVERSLGLAFTKMNTCARQCQEQRPKSGILYCKGLLHLFICFWDCFPSSSSGYGYHGEKKKSGGHFLKNGMLYFVFQNACQKVTLNKVPFNDTQIFEAGFYV
jgi:hypothetical protein